MNSTQAPVVVQALLACRMTGMVLAVSVMGVTVDARRDLAADAGAALRALCFDRRSRCPSGGLRRVQLSLSSRLCSC